MNQKAKEIGCENTWFITPNGLDATAEYSNGVGDKEVKLLQLEKAKPMTKVKKNL